MARSYLRFNLFCLCVLVVFVVGNIWSWHVVRTSQPYIEETRITPIRVPGVTAHVSTPTLQHANTTTAVAVVAPVVEHKEEPAKTLPAKFSLEVPFTSQAPEKNWAEPWQDACEEASALMMDAYYKGYRLSPLFAKDEILNMVAWEEKQGWGPSIEAVKIQSIFEQYLHLAPKKKIRLVENPTVDQVKQFIADGQPVYVVADGKTLPNTHFQNDGPEYHALIIKGYNATEFITNDPGTQFGEGYAYKYDDLMNAIRDWNNGNVKEGRRVVLVIE